MKANNQSDEWLMGQVARGRRDCLEVLVRRREYWKYLSWRMFASYGKIKVLDALPVLRVMVRKWRKWRGRR